MAGWLSKWDIRRNCRSGVWAGGSLSWESVGSWVVGWSVGDRESVFDMNNESLITKFVITGFSAI